MPGFKEWLLAEESKYLQAKEIRAAQQAVAGLHREYAAGALSADKYNQQLSRFTDEIDRAKRGSQSLSRTLHVQDLSFQGVGEAIANAVLKVGLWIAATTLVIGTVRKMQEVLQLWKDLEVTLERIGITTSTFGASLYKFFDLTADVAIRMGMPIEQTLRGMDLALRATAQYEDQAQRTATAQLMLRDAAILGNVAGMQFDQAIDILVGSLRQTGMELDQGIVLLDKWVAVAKNAAVSVNDLSQGFAIMSSAAASAGLNVDQVNGIITALSEAVTLGPVEVGNAIRALMATLYNPGSIATMRRFGVAVRDATGEFRSFWDIMNELSSMVVTGALDEDQILQIAKAAGAGQRRYAQFVALLKNWTNAIRAANTSAGAHGEALNANERIVNTLTNAWDQFTAAQNKFWYALGDKSGIISDLTEHFQRLAGVFSWFADLNEPLGKTIKLVAELAVAFVALKLAAVAITKLNLIGWLVTLARPLGGLRNLTALAGVAPGVGQVVRPAGLGAAAITARGQFQAPVGGWTAPTGQFYRGGQFLPMMATTLTRGEVARTAWSNLGTQLQRTLLTPMRGLGLAFGTAAGGMIMRELYDSDWSGIGGALGAAVGGFFLGPAGLAIGSVIGGGIAKLIEQASMSFEERVAREREKWMKDLPDEIASSLGRMREQLDLSDTVIIPLEDLMKDQEDMYDKVIQQEKDLLSRREEYIKGLEDVMMGEYGYGPGMGEAIQGAAIARWWASLFQEPQMEVQREMIPRMEEAQRKATEAAETQLTVYDELALRAEEVRKELGLQEAAEKRIEEIKERTLELTSDEREELLSLASSAPITYSRMVAQLERYLPDLAEQFRALYPSYEDFVELAPEAYGPLVEALSTAVSMEQKIADAEKTRAAATKLLKAELGGTEATLQNITDQWKYWSDIQKAVAAGAASLEPFYEAWGVTTEDATLAADEALNILNKIVQTLADGKEATQDLVNFQNQYNTALAVGEERLKYMSQYVEPGRLEFFEAGGAGLGRIQDLLTRYETMFGRYLDSQKEIYHAFIRDEEGVVRGFYETFEARPEVWQAMLVELRNIEKNTAEALEAEYNLPGWYTRPSRYWAMKTTEATEFGPAQGSLWELWMEFLAKNRGMQGGGTIKEAGPYFLHRREVVMSGDTLAGTNSILNNSYRVLAASQQYLSSINLGIVGLKQEIASLRELFTKKRGEGDGEEFARVARSNYSGVSSLGVSVRR